MGKSTISMDIFNSKLLVYQRVTRGFQLLTFLFCGLISQFVTVNVHIWANYIPKPRNKQPVLWLPD